MGLKYTANKVALTQTRCLESDSPCGLKTGVNNRMEISGAENGWGNKTAVRIVRLYCKYFFTKKHYIFKI